jgi:hypothetical protein
MARVSISTVTFLVIASATAAWAGIVHSGPHQGIEVNAAEAAAIRGGQCGSFQDVVDGACTNTQDDTCTSTGTTNCNGACEYACDSVNTYSGSGTFSGSLIPSSCDPALQPTCTQTTCTVSGVQVSCCQCLNGSNVQCGPAPYGLSPQGCSGT